MLIKYFMTAFLLISILNLAPASAEAADREFKITTYYPAPYGEYDTLKVNNPPTDGNDVATKDWVLANAGGGKCYVAYGITWNVWDPSNNIPAACAAGFSQVGGNLGTWQVYEWTGGGFWPAGTSPATLGLGNFGGDQILCCYDG